MSRIHDDRKDMYREGVLTSASNIRSIHTISQNMEKEKIEKSPFSPHSYGVNESGFRAIDLLKPKPPQGRNIVPASLGSTQLLSMPPLLPNYISGSGLLTNVPMNHSLVRGSLPPGQHAFQSHIPLGIGGGTPPRGSVTMSQRSLPSLKPTNHNQIQLPLNQIPGHPTILPPSAASSRTSSPIVSSHNLQMTNDSRLDSRGNMLSDPHAIRGNMQAPGQHGTQATIQVIASGTAVQQPHIPASFLNKGMNLNATSNMLKIGVTSHSSASPGSGMSGSAFKLGIGKAYPGSSSIIISGTTSISKPHIMEGRHNVVGPPAYNRFPTVCLPNHHIQPSHTVSTPITAIQTSSISSEPRPHAVGVPYHSITGAYVYHQEMGHSIGIHNFPQLIRPPSTSVGSLPMFPVESQRGRPPVPVVAVSSKGNAQISECQDISRSDGLTIHGGTSFNIQNLYPNLQSSSFPVTFSSATNSIESSVRPSILRKRPTETPTMFPVQPSEKERIASPIKQDNILNMVIPSRILSPPHTSEKLENSKPTNHSILSITSDLKNSSSVTEAPTTIVYSTLTKVTAPPNLLTNSISNNLLNSNVPEASPKKKPRKQLIITTEDKYGTTTPMNSCATDEDEEFLKANETMKDITPPKLTPSQPLLCTTTSHHKQLFSTETSMAANPLLDHKDIHVNGLITVTSESHSTEPVKYYIFRRRPQVSILSEYKLNTKAAHNHFYRYSDIKVKDEKKSLARDKFLNKSSLESSTGWRLHQLSTQFDDLIQVEAELCTDILLYKEDIPLPSVSAPNFEGDSKQSSEDSQLRILHDLLQGNIQRCRHSIEQLEDAKNTMFHLLEHKEKYLEIRKQRKEKTKVKKKGVS